MTADEALDGYARDVIAGAVPAGTYHRLACERHVRDRERERSDTSWPYRFNAPLADWFFEFAGRMRHYKGRQFVGKRLELTPSQQFRLGSIFGWVHKGTGLRRFRTAYNELPRKSGKSLEAAVVAIYGTFFDGEPGAEGYTAATKRDQAKIVFGDAKKLVSSTPDLKERIRVHQLNLSQSTTDSKLEPLSADYDGMDGLNPHIYVVDEFHAMKNRGLIDVLETATGSRMQPLAYQITTAGDDALSPCGDQHHYACQILDQVFADETFFAFIAHAEPDDDPLSEETWKKANPHYGVSVMPDDLRALAAKAAKMPEAMAAFKQKRLNIWVNAGTPWLNLDAWTRAQSDHPNFAADLDGGSCYLGLDLASKIDLAALAAVFPPSRDARWRILSWFFTPEDGLREREKQYRVPLQRWVREAHIEATPGGRIDYGRIMARIEWCLERFDVRRIGADPWNLGDLGKRLVELMDHDETRVLEVPQSFAQMSEPSKEFAANVAEGLVDANGHPVLTWNVGNAVVDQDANENIRPTKNPRKLRGRIDGLIAAIIGTKLARVDDVDDAPTALEFLDLGPSWDR